MPLFEVLSPFSDEAAREAMPRGRVTGARGNSNTANETAEAVHVVILLLNLSYKSKCLLIMCDLP